MRKLANIALPLIGLALLFSATWGGRTRAEDDAGYSVLIDDPDDRQRIGFCVSQQRGPITDYDVSGLQAGWYYDYRFRANPDRPHGMEYVQIISTKGYEFPPTENFWGVLRAAVLANPGSMWMIGNEPDCVDQDNNTPVVYARRFHDVREFIVGLDPTAQIANGGIVQPTLLRLLWLDTVIEEYQDLFDVNMVDHVDVWNIHNQILHEERNRYGCGIPPGFPEINEGANYVEQDSDNLQIFREHVRVFRRWMKDHGQQDKPLIISEYGVLMALEYGFPADRVNDFMTASFIYLLNATDPDLGCPSDGNRLVQRWAWFSLNESPWNADPDPEFQYWGFNGALFDWQPATYPGELTKHGEHWIELMDSWPLPSPTPITTPAPLIFRREVEDGTLYEPMAEGYDEFASSCYYVKVPPGHGGGSVYVSLYAREPGSYIIWARVLAPEWGQNHFRVVVDRDPAYSFEWELPVGGWTWDMVSEVGGADPKIFNFIKAGWHVFRFYVTDNGGRLDALEFMKTGTAPEYYLQPCVEPTLAATPTVTSTPEGTPTATITLMPTVSPTLTPTPWGVTFRLLLPSLVK